MRVSLFLYADDAELVLIFAAKLSAIYTNTKSATKEKKRIEISSQT